MRETKFVAAGLIALTMIGCNPNLGFQANSSLVNLNPGGDDGNNSQDCAPNCPIPQPGWENVALEGTVDGGSANGVLALQIDPKEQTLILTFPLPLSGPIVSFEHAKLPGVKIISVFNANGTQAIAFVIPLKYIVKKLQITPDISKLPNGDPLPGFPASEVAGLGMEFPAAKDRKIYTYLGVDAVAFFLELPKISTPPDIIGNFILPIKNESKTKIVGYIGYVLPKGNFKGGAYIAAKLPTELARYIERIVKF